MTALSLFSLFLITWDWIWICLHIWAFSFIFVIFIVFINLRRTSFVVRGIFRLLPLCLFLHSRTGVQFSRWSMLIYSVLRTFLEEWRCLSMWHWYTVHLRDMALRGALSRSTAVPPPWRGVWATLQTWGRTPSFHVRQGEQFLEWRSVFIL